MKGVFITGTDTNVGKTWVGEQLIKELRDRNINVIPRKPIESGWAENDITQTDAWILANAANKTKNLAKTLAKFMVVRTLTSSAIYHFGYNYPDIGG